jgi:hypothetical protein
MAPHQKQLAMRLLRTGLSEAAYVTASTIMSMDNLLDAREGWRLTSAGERIRDPGRYFVRIFGDPTGGGPWSWRIGGHHVSVQHVVVDGTLVGSTPCFLGSNPASAPLLGPHPLRPLAGAEDLGRELVRSLDAAQLGSALLAPVAPVDLVSGNRVLLHDGDPPSRLREVWRQPISAERARRQDELQAEDEARAGITPEIMEAVRFTAEPRGISAEKLTIDQRELLRALLDVYVRRLPDDIADLEAEQYRSDAGLDRLSFAWAGATEPGLGHYYRVQGGDLFVEYDNTQDDANHVHTVWRDLRRDFGRDPLREHYEEAHDHG